MSSRRKKIGLLGGSFDPPHLGHLTLAQDAYEKLDLDSVWFIPTYLSPHKKAFNVSPEQRAGMVALMLEKDERFECCKLEVESDLPQYSIATVQTLQSMHPDVDFFWLIGADQLRTLHLWKEIRKFAELVTLVVFKRPGYPIELSGEIADIPIKQVEIHEVMISSSEIRNRIMQKLPVYIFLHPAVNHHIKKNYHYTK